MNANFLLTYYYNEIYLDIFVFEFNKIENSLKGSILIIIIQKE